MRRALIDHSTLSAVQRLLGVAPTHSPESVDGDITAFEGFIQAILFWDEQFWVDDYKEPLKQSRLAAFPFMQRVDDLLGFERKEFIRTADGFTRDFLLEVDGEGDFSESEVQTFLQKIVAGVGVNWHFNGRTSEYFLSIGLMQRSAKSPIEKYGYAQSAFYALTQRPNSAFLIERRVIREQLASELSELAESLNWLASRTAYYSAIADGLGLELILHPIRHDFRLRLIEKLLPMNQGLFDSVLQKLTANLKDTISKVFLATDPVIAKLDLPVFTAVLAARTGDPRNFILEAQHIAQEGPFVEARQRLSELEQLTAEPRDVRFFRTEVNKLLRELDRTSRKILSAYGVETPQGIPVSSAIKLFNLALNPAGVLVPDIASGSIIPMPTISRGRNFGAIYRSILSELTAVARLGKLHSCIRSRIELVRKSVDEGQGDIEGRRAGRRKVWWLDSTDSKNLDSEQRPLDEQSNDAGNAKMPARASQSLRNIDEASNKWTIDDIDMMSHIEECTNIELIFVPWNCERCQSDIIVFHAGALNPDADSMLEVTSFMYWPDILEEVDLARIELGLPRMGFIKPRTSRTGGRKRVSQGCPNCDTAVEEMDMHEDFTTICGEGGIFGNPKFKRKMTPSWPPEGFKEVAEQVRAEYEENGD